VVAALEGAIAPIECISEAADGSLVCSRELGGHPSQPGAHGVCPTKVLWTKVRMSIVSTLRETTLADLVASPVVSGAYAERPTGATLPALETEPLSPTLTTGA
jgi:DNA-binding IscR family transcriptional regulator